MSFVYLLSQRISLFNSGKLELWIISFFSSTTSKVHTKHERNQPYIRLRDEGIGHLKITIIGTQVVKDLLWHDNIPNVNIIEWSLLLHFQEGICAHQFHSAGSKCFNFSRSRRSTAFNGEICGVAVRIKLIFKCQNNDELLSSDQSILSFYVVMIHRMADFYEQ